MTMGVDEPDESVTGERVVSYADIVAEARGLAAAMGYERRWHIGRTLQKHPQVRSGIDFVRVWLFTCPGCGTEYYARGARVQADGTLLCIRCNEDPAAEERTREWQAPQQSEPRTRECDHCGRSFTYQRGTARFCSQRCRTAAHRAAAGRA
jgi:hypothetical protein